MGKIKMGFEARTPRESFGKAQWVTVGGQKIRVKSEAEALFARVIDAAITGGLVKEWQYEPKAYPIDYKYRTETCTDTYTPDFRIVWNSDEGEVWYEVKRGALQPKYASKLRRFMDQYPDKKVVLVWLGSEPKRGAVARRFNRLRRMFHHIWYLK